MVTRYAPTGEADEEERDTYDSLQTTLEDDPTHDVLVLLGNYVARVYSDNTDHGQTRNRQDD